MYDSFEDLRGETRGFHCPNKLWKEILRKSEGIMSISAFIRIAILEKLIKDEPEKEEYFRDLLTL